MNTKILRGAAALGLALTLGACSDMLSLDAAGDVAMTLQKTSEPLFGAPQGSPSQTRALSPDTVESFVVTFTAIEFQHEGDAEAGTWTTMRLNAPVTVDLMSAPSQLEAALRIANGQVEAGSYAKVRLIVGGAKIRFKGDVSFGVAGLVQGDAEYRVKIGGTRQEIEAGVSLDVAAHSSSTIELLFNQTATLSSVSLEADGSLGVNAVVAVR